MKSKTGGNVQLGCYAKGDQKGMSNGKHGKPRMFMDTHRENSGVPKIKGHHFKGKMSRKTGSTFG